MDNKLTGCLQKDHSEVEHGSYITEGKVIALRPVCCAKSETEQQGSGQEGLAQKQATADSKTGPSFY